MTLVPDEYVFAPATEAEFGGFVLDRLPTAKIHSDCFDLFVEIPGADIVPIETAYNIARAMRNGRDPDRQAPSDWHVRSLQPLRDIPERPALQAEPWPVVGTSIWFSRSYALPAEYDENDEHGRTLAAPGSMPLRQ